MLVTTIYGDTEESELEKKTGVTDNPNETATWVEYWKDGELVHRSVHVSVKEGAVSKSLVGSFD